MCRIVEFFKNYGMAGVMMLIGVMIMGMYLGVKLDSWAVPKYGDVLFCASQVWTVDHVQTHEAHLSGATFKDITVAVRNSEGMRAQINAVEWGSAYNHYLDVKKGDILIYEVGKGAAAYKGLTVDPPAFQYLDLVNVIKN